METPNWDIIYWNDGVVVLLLDWTTTTTMPSTAPDSVVAEPISMVVDGVHPMVVVVDLDPLVDHLVDPLVDHLVAALAAHRRSAFGPPIDISIPIASRRPWRVCAHQRRQMLWPPLLGEKSRLAPTRK